MFSKKDWKYIAFFVGAIIVVILSEVFTPKPIDWTKTYGKSDKNPYGNYVLFNQLADIFGDEQINVNKITAYEATEQEEWEGYKTVIYINEEFNPSELELEALSNWVANGNTAFVAATDFQGAFADTFNIETSRRYFQYQLNEDNEIEGELNLENVGMNFVHPNLKKDQAYFYKRGTTSNYFMENRMEEYTLLGEDEELNAHYIRIAHGAGHFYLHSNPLVFTNYNMLNNNGKYISSAFSYLPKGPVIWDEYYKSGRGGATTPLRYILSQSPLRWAWFLALGTLIFFVLFNIKRKQRIIPIVTPPSNTTLEFVETIGKLYYQNKDHKDLVVKKIRYFKEYIRQHFFLTMQHWDTHELAALSAKSGLTQEQVSVIGKFILSLKGKQVITEQELLTLSKKIDMFKELAAKISA